MRAGHVRRWHIVAMAREQTIGDHMYRVQLITEALLYALGAFSWNNNITLNAMEWARVHDLPEVIIGDIPTPGKTAIRESEDWDAPAGKGDGVTEAEDRVDGDIATLRACVTDIDECPLAGLVVKLADLCEAANYCGIYGLGQHARDTWWGLRAEAFLHLDKLCNYEVFVEDARRELREIVESLVNVRPSNQ
jgi:5'-deoxynucleotidase